MCLCVMVGSKMHHYQGNVCAEQIQPATPLIFIMRYAPFPMECLKPPYYLHQPMCVAEN